MGLFAGVDMQPVTKKSPATNFGKATTASKFGEQYSLLLFLVSFKNM